MPVGGSPWLIAACYVLLRTPTPAAAPPGTPAPTPPPWKAEVADKDEVIEVVESIESIKPSEAAVIETVEATKPIISIEVSVAKASHARG